MEKFIQENKNVIIIFAVFLAFCIITYEKDRELVIPENEEIILEENQVQEKVNYVVIHIAGNVGKPGVYKLEEGSRIDDLIVLSEISDLEILDQHFNRAKLLFDGEKIYIPTREELEHSSFEFKDNEGSKDHNKININKAGVSELTSLPGIGEKKAEEIIRFREKNGNFKNIDDIMMVTGIGNATFEKIREFITT